MKTLATIATVTFWLVFAAIHGLAARETTPAPAPAAAPNAPAAPAPGTPAAERRHRLVDVATHADARSCWMVIDGVVYDFTDYLPQHPADPAVMLRHCGREASEAFRTKDAGRPHSPYAQRLLAKYRIGVLAR